MSRVLHWLVVLDFVVCSAFTAQLLLFPDSVLAQSFGTGAPGSGSPSGRDLARLLGGLYLSWSVLLAFIASSVPKTRKLACFLLISAVAQLPIALLFESVTAQFRTINVCALLFWSLSYACVVMWQ